MNKPRPNVFRLVAHMLAAVFNSRSAFQEKWTRYESLPKEQDPIAGRWTGEWISQQSGHRGELRCVLSAVAPGTYRAYFYAIFSKLFRVGYATELKAQQTDGRLRLSGQEDLGPLAGGIYRCEGQVKGSELDCHYSCKYDHGIFRLKRLD